MAEVLCQRFPEFGEFTVRVAIEPGGRRRDGFGDGRLNIGRNTMGVFVHVEQNRDIKLRSAIGA